MIKYTMDVGQVEQDIIIEIALMKINKRRKFTFVMAVIAGVAMVISLITAYMWHIDRNCTFEIVCLIGCICIMVVFSKPFLRMILRHAQNKMDINLISGLREYEFDLDGIIIKSNMGIEKGNWNAFKCWGIMENYIYIKDLNEGVLLVRQNELSEMEAEELKMLLTKNLKTEYMKGKI